MRLDRVDVFGFKSFGERTELAFHEGVTAIVGPNGCGKSNISDAIGWALGEQSAKSLRGQKMEDVIFNGSEARAPLGLAEVNLRLSQFNGDFPGARREVVVTRRLYRSGESEYLMDGSPCRLRDIHELFMDTGVGTKAYSIIEQGKIGLILSSKPTDRRILIEEAAGITKYKARRHAAELKLEAAQQNLLRVNDIIYEVERQLNSLKRQAAKARRYQRLRDSMTRLEKISSVQRSRETEARLNRSRARLRTLADEELRRSTGLATAETYLERLRLELAERERDMAERREALHALELSIERLNNQISSDRQQIEDLARRRSQLDAERSGLEERYGPAAEHLAARTKDESALAAEFSRSEEEAAAAQSALAGALAALAEIEHEMEEERAELVSRVSKVAALRNFLQGVAAGAEKLSGEILKLQQEVREHELERSRLERERAELEAEMSERRAVAETLSSDRLQAEARAASLREEMEAIEQDLARRREEISSLSGRLASLEELVAARAHFGAGVRSLLEAAPALGVRLEGVVADSIEVDPRFERAAERFYGEALQRIVVAGEEDAVRLQSHLEREKAGRCDFLIESLAGASASITAREALASLESRGARGLAGVLSERVRWTGDKRELLARSLPDAVVVEGVEEALEAFRLEPGTSYVTLGGEVVEPPGVLRAGPGGPGEGLLSSRREIRELRKTIEQMTGSIEDLDRRRTESQAELAAVEVRLGALREEQHVLEKILVGLDHRRQHLEEEQLRAGRTAEVLANEQARSESERDSLAAKRIEIERTLEAEERVRSEIESRLERAGWLLAEKRQAVERLQARATEEASRQAALRERVQAVRLDLERLRQGMSELESRIRSHREELGRLEERNRELNLGLARAGQGTEAALAERDVARAGLGALEEEARALRSRIEETETAIKLRRKELEKAREARATEEVAVAREESELAHLGSSFFETHGISLEEAAAVLTSADLRRDGEAIRAELGDLKLKLDSLGPVNPMAIEEFRELEARFEFLTGQRKDLLDSIASTGEAIRRIDATSRQRFEEAFNEINRHFDATFRQLFGGGRAGLALIEEQDLLESGIDITAQPPGKRLQNVLLLSGGEKALTAIALMFAIFRYKPSPFCVLDEVDAPLDDANLSRFLLMLGELRKSTQFIIITHNRRTMEIADQMYGVTMEEPGISKLVSVKLVDEGSPEAVAAAS